jgi:predicted N-acetyltransferase YhbS
MAISIREARSADAAECGRICYEAFADIANAHNFPPDFPSVEATTRLMSSLIGAPGFYAVVAEDDGKIVGSNFLNELDPISGVGPISIDPKAQNRGIGALLMRAVMERSVAKCFVGIRLVQSGYHSRSLSLYSKLGFEIREHLSCFHGAPVNEAIRGYDVRVATREDVEACNALCFNVHGVARGGDLDDAVTGGMARVVERNGRITGYTTAIAFPGHALAESTDDIIALIAAAAALRPPGFLVPSRNGPLMRWCLSKGFRVTQSLTLMTMGLYNEPAGAYLPSILY